jgi:predicted enzyme related to lactoylglutathione lyase
MFKDTKAFSSFSVNDLEAAKQFYGEVLGLNIVEQGDMGITLDITGNNGVFLYNKPNHEPAAFTVLNFPVDDIDQALADLEAKDVVFEHYDGMGQDEKGVMRGKAEGNGPDIAWFKDPAGNILSILQD